MYFETKHKTVFSPRNSELEPFYTALEKYAPVLSGSRVFEELIEIYETLDTQELNAEEELTNESTI